MCSPFVAGVSTRIRRTGYEPIVVDANDQQQIDPDSCHVGPAVAGRVGNSLDRHPVGAKFESSGRGEMSPGHPPSPGWDSLVPRGDPTSAGEGSAAAPRRQGGLAVASRSSPLAVSMCAAGQCRAKRQFRRVNGYHHLRALRIALEQHVSETVTPRRYGADKEVVA